MDEKKLALNLFWNFKGKTKRPEGLFVNKGVNFTVPTAQICHQ